MVVLYYIRAVGATGVPVEVVKNIYLPQSWYLQIEQGVVQSRGGKEIIERK